MFLTHNIDYDALARDIASAAKYEVTFGHHSKSHGLFKWRLRAYYYISFPLSRFEKNCVRIPSLGDIRRSNFERKSFEEFSKKLLAAVKDQEGVLDSGIFWSSSSGNGVIGGHWQISISIDADSL